MNVGEIKYFTHSSKTKCVFVDNKELPLICIDIWCRAGSSFEDEKKKGAAHFLEHMIFKGSSEIKPGEFDYRIESLGGLSNASTGYDDAHYYVLVPPNNFKESLALLTNIVFAPEIDVVEFNVEKNVIIDEIKQQNDQPDEKIFNYFLNRVWETDNYKKPILGNEQDLEILEKQDLEKFHMKQYNSENVCIAITGNLNKEIYKAFMENNIPYKNTKKINRTNQNKKEHKAVARTGREEINYENIEFSRIFMAWNIPSIKNQKVIIGLEILASILSVGRESRLVKVLKEENNLIESVYIDINAGELGGLFIIEACCDDKNLNFVEVKINEIITEIIDIKKITLNELRKAINIVKSNYVFNLETSIQLSSYFGNDLLWGRKNSIKNIEIYLEHWNNLNNFKEILNFLSNDKFTLVASSCK